MSVGFIDDGVAPRASDGDGGGSGRWILRVHAEDISLEGAGGIAGFTIGLVSGFTRASSRVCIELIVPENNRNAWVDELPKKPNLTIVGYGTQGLTRKLVGLDRVRGRLRRSRIAWTVRMMLRQRRQAALGSHDDAVPVVDYFPFHRGGTFGRRRAITVHDLRAWDPEFGDEASRRNVAENVSAAGVVFTSWKNPEQEIIARFPEVRDKLFRVPFPIMNEAVAVTDAPHDPSGERLIIYPAAVVPHKNHRILVDFVESYRPADIKFLFTGNDQTEYGMKLRRDIEGKGLSPWFTFAGFLPSDELARNMKRSWALVMPSLYEAASGPVMEAMVSAVPVICADLPVFRDQISECGGDAVWFDPRAAESLNQAIETVRRDRRKSAEGASVGGRWYAELSWDTAAREYLNLIESRLVRDLL